MTAWGRGREAAGDSARLLTVRLGIRDLARMPETEKNAALEVMSGRMPEEEEEKRNKQRNHFDLLEDERRRHVDYSEPCR